MKINYYVVMIALFLGVKGSSQSQPNILWIVTDDHRADALACFNEATTGEKESALGYVSSPNLDQLAKEGALFVNAFCNSPACGPSRGSMLSGRYPFKSGHYSFNPTHQAPDFTKPTFPQELQKSGYNTALFGKDAATFFNGDLDKVLKMRIITIHLLVSNTICKSMILVIFGTNLFI